MGWPCGAQRRHAFSQSSPPWTAYCGTRTLFVPVLNLKTWESWAANNLRLWARIMRLTFQLKEIKILHTETKSRSTKRENERGQVQYLAQTSFQAWSVKRLWPYWKRTFSGWPNAGNPLAGEMGPSFPREASQSTGFTSSCPLADW